MIRSNQIDEIAICVCTFRRPQLLETLNSLFELEIPKDFGVSVHVIDNDHSPTAKALVQQAAATAPFPVVYTHCPAGNISIARNCALETCDARYLAFIDDDEIASRNWLLDLVQVATCQNVDVVLGPVQALYADDAPNWMQKVALHSTQPVWVDGKIKTGYSCNVLIDRNSPAVDGLRFDLNLGQSGGEDTKYFHQVFRRGGQIGYAHDALVYEDVPTARTSFIWLIKRHIRMGQTHGQLLAEGKSGPMGVAKGLLIATSKMAYCGGAAALSIWHSGRRNTALLRGFLHFGVVLGLIGMRGMRLYGAGLSGEQQL